MFIAFVDTQITSRPVNLNSTFSSLSTFTSHYL